MSKLKVDIITEDPAQNEFVLHLVEEGPWDLDAVTGRLRAIQDRLYDAVDLVIDGHLARRYPESKGRKIRIQLDCYDAPNEVHELASRFQQHLKVDPPYRDAVEANVYASSIRVVSQRGVAGQTRQVV